MSDTAAPRPRADFWREMAIAVVMGMATLASGWSSFQSGLWEGIQTFRLAAVDNIGRDLSVKRVALGQEHLLDLYLLERYLDARESGEARADFLFGRMPPELQAATRSWLDTRPRDNPAAARSPFHLPGYAQAGTGAVAELLKKQSDAYAEADNANKISDSYVRLTVIFGLAMFLAGISAVIKGLWPRRVLIASSAAVLALALALLAQMPLAAE